MVVDPCEIPPNIPVRFHLKCSMPIKTPLKSGSQFKFHGIRKKSHFHLCSLPTKHLNSVNIPIFSIKMFIKSSMFPIATFLVSGPSCRSSTCCPRHWFAIAIQSFPHDKTVDSPYRDSKNIRTNPWENSRRMIYKCWIFHIYGGFQ